MGRVLIASVLLQVHVGWKTCIASGLIIFSIYAYDRIKDYKFEGSNKIIGYIVIIIASLIGVYIYWTNVNIPIGVYTYRVNVSIFLAIFPFIVCYFYTEERKIGKLTINKLKGSYGEKNIVVGFTWGIFIVGSIGYTNRIPFLIVFFIMLSKSFINSTIEDFKDITEDSLAGLRTIPIWLGERITIVLLLVIFFISNVMLYFTMARGIFEFNYIILLCSFFGGLFGILRYKTTQSWFSLGIRFGEPIIAVILIRIAKYMFSMRIAPTLYF